MAEKKYLLLYLTTGGGHKSIARSLARAIAEAEPGCAAVAVDALPASSRFRRGILESGYRFVSTNKPALWKVLFEFSRTWIAMALWDFLMRHTVRTRLGSLIRRGGYDGVISLHFLLNSSLEAFKRRGLPGGGAAPPSLTVVTDPFYIHPVWHRHLSGKRVLFSERAARDSAAMGVAPGDMKILPFPFDESFRPATRERAARAKATIGADPEGKLALIMGGGEGFPGGATYFRALLASGAAFDLAIVCGRDAALKADCEAALAATPPAPGRRALVFGFVDSMSDIVAASDVVIAKGGPSSIFEVLAAEKPLIVARFAHGQERGNVEWLLKEGLGWYVRDPAALRGKVEALLEDSQALSDCKKRIKAAGLASGMRALAEYALEGDWKGAPR